MPRIRTLVTERGAQQPRKVEMMMRDILKTRLWRSRRSRCRLTARRRAMIADTEAWTPTVAGMGVAAPMSELTSGAEDDTAWGEVAVGVGDGMRGGWLSCLVLSVVHCSPPNSPPSVVSPGFSFFCLLWRPLQEGPLNRWPFFMWEPMRMFKALNILE